MEMKSFKQLEYEGWTARASTFDDHFAEMTGAAIDPILDSLEPLDGQRLLDVGCGTGHLAAAARRGAEVLGVDFVESMVARAQTNYPGIAFRLGDAEALDCDDASFEAVTCSFALLHLSDQEAAVAEAFRVLHSGGRYAFTAWRGPEDGREFFALTRRAIEAHGSGDVGLPAAAPPGDRLATPEVASETLAAAGFVEPELRDLSLVWRNRSAQAIMDAIYEGGVRTAMVMRAQSAEARARIEAAILEAAEGYRKGDVIELAMPAVLVTARKP